MAGSKTAVRRVVTGEVDGKGIIASDATAPTFDMGGGAQVFEVWRAPGATGGYGAGEAWSLDPPAGGSVFRIAEFPGATRESEPYMHRTPTIDFGVVLEGELTLVLDIGETVLRAGDTFVQRQARHAWVNRGAARVRMAVVLMDGEQ